MVSVPSSSGSRARLGFLFRHSAEFDVFQSPLHRAAARGGRARPPTACISWLGRAFSPLFCGEPRAAAPPGAPPMGVASFQSPLHRGAARGTSSPAANTLLVGFSPLFIGEPRAADYSGGQPDVSHSFQS